jgi:hypothetical protein
MNGFASDHAVRQEQQTDKLVVKRILEEWHSQHGRKLIRKESVEFYN